MTSHYFLTLTPLKPHWLLSRLLSIAGTFLVHLKCLFPLPETSRTSDIWMGDHLTVFKSLFEVITSLRPTLSTLSNTAPSLALLTPLTLPYIIKKKIALYIFNLLHIVLLYYFWCLMFVFLPVECKHSKRVGSLFCSFMYFKCLEHFLAHE